ALPISGVDSVAIWASAPPPDGVLLGQAQFGAPRQDVVSQTRNTAALNSGFTFTLDTTALPDGPQTLYIVATPLRGDPIVKEISVTVANRAPTGPNGPTTARPAPVPAAAAPAPVAATVPAASA